MSSSDENTYFDSHDSKDNSNFASNSRNEISCSDMSTSTCPLLNVSDSCSEGASIDNYGNERIADCYDISVRPEPIFSFNSTSSNVHSQSVLDTKAESSSKPDISSNVLIISNSNDDIVYNCGNADCITPDCLTEGSVIRKSTDLYPAFEGSSNDSHPLFEQPNIFTEENLVSHRLEDFFKNGDYYETNENDVQKTDLLASDSSDSLNNNSSPKENKSYFYTGLEPQQHKSIQISDINMNYREEINELAEKCIAKILIERERIFQLMSDKKRHDVVNRRLQNLSLQEQQFEHIISDTKVQLSYACTEALQNAKKICENIKNRFGNECRLFENFFPAYAFRGEILTLMSEYQVTVISADSSYCFNYVLPLIIEEQYPQDHIVSCESSEIAEVKLFNWLGSFFGDRIQNSLISKNLANNAMFCTNEEDLLNHLSKVGSFTSRKPVFLIYNLPLFRSLETDMVLMKFQHFFKFNEYFRVVLLTTSSTDAIKYKNYFSKSTFVSYLKTESLCFPVSTVWKNSSLSPENDYVNEVVRTILAVLELKDFGDILAFFCNLNDAKAAVTILNEQLLKHQIGNTESILIHKTTVSIVLDSNIDICKRRVFLATSCAESIVFPSVQFVVDCGIRTLYFYDKNDETDLLKTSFISCQNAKLRKNFAGVSIPGICYRIYCKKNYLFEMLPKDYPEVLRRNPINTMLKICQFHNIDTQFSFIEYFSDEVEKGALNILNKYNAIKIGRLTSIGKLMAQLPFKIKYSKLILLGMGHGLAFETAVLVSFFLNKKNIFKYSSDKNQQRLIECAKLQLGRDESDPITYLNIYKEFVDREFSVTWCTEHCIDSEVLRNVHRKALEICQVLETQMQQTVHQKISDIKRTSKLLTQILFDCFYDNLCVYSGHSRSGYKVLSSASIAFIHVASVLCHNEHVPQFVLFDHMLSGRRNFLVHVTPISDELIMEGLMSKKLEFDYTDLFEKSMVYRVISPIREGMMNEMLSDENGKKLKEIEEQVRKETGSNLIIFELSVDKRQAYVYALPEHIDFAQCVIEDIIKVKFSNILCESQVEKLGLKNGRNKLDVEISWSKGALITSVCFLSLNRTSVATSKIPANEEFVPYIDEPTHLPYQLCLSWVRRPCSGEGFVNFACSTSFMPARKLALKYIVVLGSDAFIQVSKTKVNQLCIKGLPPETKPGDIERQLNILLQNSRTIDSIELKHKPQFETSTEDIQSLKSIIVRECEHLNLFCQYEVIVPEPRATDLDMKVYINSENDVVLDMLTSVLPNAIARHTNFAISHCYSVIIKCNLEMCKALQPRLVSELTQIKRQLKEHGPNATNADCIDVEVDAEKEDKAIIKISSSNNKILEFLHRRVSTLLEGDFLNGKNMRGLENLFFYGGQKWLTNVEKTEDILIVKDNRTKTLRLYGSVTACENTKLRISKFLEVGELELTQTVSLSTENQTGMLLKAIIKEYGLNLDKFVQLCELRSAVLDIKARQLILHGTQESIDNAENYIKAISTGLDIIIPTIEQAEEICPVCACPALNLTFRLEHCGHIYCIDCIQALVEQAQFPVKCCAENCSKDIVLRDIKEVLRNDSDKIQNLLEKSLKDYQERSRSKIVFCPAPDCSMFFYKAEVSGNRLNCPLCKNDICTSCNVLYHGGYSCEMYQNSKNDPDYSFKAWQKTTTKCKQCPRCKTAIEKVSGCNRMYCSSCKGHFCWICVKEFKTGQGVYSHIESAHPGMLFM